MLNQDGSDKLGETVARPIQATLDRPQVASGDLGYFLVALSFELPEHEHLSVVLRQALNALIHSILQKTLAIQIVWASRRILELERPMVRFSILLDRLEQDQGVPAPIAELVLGQVRRDCIDPSGELLCLIEPMQVAEDPDEDFLNQVLRALTVTDRTIYEVEEPRLVPVDQGAKGLGFAIQMPHNHLTIVQIVQRLAPNRARRFDRGSGWERLQRRVHSFPHVANGNTEKPLVARLAKIWHKPCLPGSSTNALQFNGLRVAVGCESGILSDRADKTIPHSI